MNKLLLLLFLLVFITPVNAATIKDLVVTTNAGALAIPDYVDAKVLAAGVAETQTVPVDTNSLHAEYVLFSANCDFYVGYDETASVPTDTADGTSFELNPTIRWLDNTVSTISVISASTCIVTMSFYM
jgi:hypothetical protein